MRFARFDPAYHYCTYDTKHYQEGEGHANARLRNAPVEVSIQYVTLKTLLNGQLALIGRVQLVAILALFPYIKAVA
jgi:hypothetical protein